MMDSFDIAGRTAVVTGGYGILGGVIAEALADAGARIAVLGRNVDEAESKVDTLRKRGADAMVLIADVLDESALEAACARVLDVWGTVDILVNAAGGNVARARTDGIPVFEMPLDAFDEVMRLNLHGSVYPTLIFGKAMARQKKGVVINISSMAAVQAISGVPGYSAAKAAIDNITKWMAVDLARRYGEGLRVNAIAPGFFVAKQNRDVLINPDGTYTERAKKILGGTPMGRFGDPLELQGPVLWLCSDASSFVTGAVIPIDGGFSADSGV